MTCRICSGSVLWPFTATEMFFGTRNTFEYCSCPTCGSVQIATIPSDEEILSFYPNSYWNSKAELEIGSKNTQRFVFFSLYRAASLSGALRRFIANAKPRTAFRALSYGINPKQRVLDVGCGNGDFIRGIAHLGVVEAVGVDPYASDSVTFANNAKVIRGRLTDMPVDYFDVITFHHSLEHVPDFVDTLAEAAKRLKASGHCVVRLPVTSSEAFRKYGAHWVQLDAPRHLTIPSRNGMAIAATRAGLTLELTIDDSTALQFWGSELYKRNIPLRGSETNSAIDPFKVFSSAEMTKFARRARQLNRGEDGDQAIFILRKTSK